MAQEYKIHDQSAAHFLTFQVVQWVDIFTKQVYRDIVIDSFKYCQKNKGLELYAYVIMSNHVHLIARSLNDALSDLIRDIKRHTSRQMLDLFQQDFESRRKWMELVFKYEAKGNSHNNIYQLWTNENHPEELTSNKFFRQKLNYIHENPVRAGLIDHPEDYRYSSARNYAGMDALCDVELLSGM